MRLAPILLGLLLLTVALPSVSAVGGGTCIPQHNPPVYTCFSYNVGSPATFVHSDGQAEPVCDVRPSLPCTWNFTIQ